MVERRFDAGIRPTGQVVGLIDSLPTVAEVIESVMTEAESVLSRLGTGVG